MDANALYKASLMNSHHSVKNDQDTHGFTSRVYLAMKRANLVEQDGHIDIAKLTDVVVSGDIWKCRGMGEKTIQVICKWLAARVSLLDGICRCGHLISAHGENNGESHVDKKSGNGFCGCVFSRKQAAEHELKGQE